MEAADVAEQTYCKKRPGAHSGSETKMSAVTRGRSSPSAQPQQRGLSLKGGGGYNYWRKFLFNGTQKEVGTRDQVECFGRKQSGWVWAQDPSLHKESNASNAGVALEAAPDNDYDADDDNHNLWQRQRMLLRSVLYHSNTLGRVQTTTTATLTATTTPSVNDENFCGPVCSSTATPWRQITI